MSAPGFKKHLSLAALVFWCAGPAAASLVSGDKELVRLTKDSPAALTLGDKSLFFTSEPEVAAPLSNGGAEAKVGFYSGLA